ncbi:YeiH family protein [Clostridium sp. HBUAS56017]|uniref:YeiH family protein n=1 Tax=Clostridium sp. HBUAS56017 TaxID=2571128 RepID=UPI001177611B|nr:YeiH family protein [Clostridium sp. HBUAS56017]
MEFIKKNYQGLLFCLLIAIIAALFGEKFTIIGGPVFGILLGLIIALFPRKNSFESGIKFTSKKILQYAIILLGFGMNFFQIFKVGSQSLLIIISTISTSLIVSYVVSKLMKIPSNISILVGVGSSICGGSAIAATAPVIDAKDEDIAKSISVIFLFNVIAAFLFPVLGDLLGFNDIGFGMWAGTAINDTSSVVAAGQTWSSAHGSDIALHYATIVKLTRTLAIIPITLILALYRSKKNSTTTVKLSKIFPWFILFFLLAAIISTVFNMSSSITKPLTEAGKFFITMAMVAIGLNTNIVKLIKTGRKPIIMGLCCWISIASVSLFIQHTLHIW